MNIQNLIPKDKHDFDSVNQLRLVDKDALRPIIPDLLVWLQDTNWPISSAVGEILLQFNGELIPYIQDVLKTDDDIWKYYVLSKLVSKFSKEDQSRMLDELNRLAYHPNKWEKSEEVDVIAKEILESLA